MKEFKSVEEFVKYYCPGLNFTLVKNDNDFLGGWHVLANGRTFNISDIMIGPCYYDGTDARDELGYIMRQELGWQAPVLKKCVFARNPNSGEPAYYCGEVGDNNELRKAITNIVLGELDSLLYGTSAKESIQFEIKEMTDEELASLPEI
jgi:hypothetical protein